MDLDKICDSYNLCIHKIKRNIEKMPYGLREYPQAENGNYFDVEEKHTKELRHIMNWTTSFFTGMALLAYHSEGDKCFLDWVKENYSLYYEKVFAYPEETMHDLGFLYSLYSVSAYNLTNDTDYRIISIKAADELAKRYVMNGEYIRAWGRMDGKVSSYIPTEEKNNHFFTKSEGLAIIDCMMNLPLLLWASEVTGNNFYKDIAVKHADTTARFFIRADFSVYHAYKFDSESGRALEGCNYCGYGKESYWARGAAWAIYGFILAYKYTGKKDYLETSIRLGERFVENLDESGVPAWDFRLDENMPKNKDSSAAAIVACGFQEILKYNPGNTLFAGWVDRILETLTEDNYTDCNLECPGILKQQNGAMAYTVFGDYFYMEALARKLNAMPEMW